MIQIEREVIDKEILKHFEKHFNAQSPQLDMEFKFEHKINGSTLKFIVPYSNCQINIYDDECISCTCCDFDVEFEIVTKEKSSLVYDLTMSEDKLVQEYEISIHESEAIAEHNRWMELNNR